MLNKPYYIVKVVGLDTHEGMFKASIMVVNAVFFCGAIKNVRKAWHESLGNVLETSFPVRHFPTSAVSGCKT